jgi:hypothetical protein
MMRAQALRRAVLAKTFAACPPLPLRERLGREVNTVVMGRKKFDAQRRRKPDVRAARLPCLPSNS